MKNWNNILFEISSLNRKFLFCILKKLHPPSSSLEGNRCQILAQKTLRAILFLQLFFFSSIHSSCKFFNLILWTHDLSFLLDIVLVFSKNLFIFYNWMLLNLNNTGRTDGKINISLNPDISFSIIKPFHKMKLSWIFSTKFSLEYFFKEIFRHFGITAILLLKIE